MATTRFSADRPMPLPVYGVDARRMVVDVLGALLFMAAFMFAWTSVGAIQQRQNPPAE